MHEIGNIVCPSFHLASHIPPMTSFPLGNLTRIQQTHIPDRVGIRGKTMTGLLYPLEYLG